MRTLCLLAFVLTAACTQPHSDNAVYDTESAIATNEAAANRLSESFATNPPAEAVNLIDQESIADEWFKQAERCGHGEADACERANAIIRRSPDANDDACANGDPRGERCAPIREAQSRGLLE